MNKIIRYMVRLFILMMLFFMFASNALAAGYRTYDGSIDTYQAFRKGTNNTVGYDADGAYDRQCWDGVQVFYQRLGMSLSTGNVYNSEGKREGYAKHCWDDVNARAANTGTQFTQIARIEDVKRGDIIVFSGPYYTGHIAFADEDNNPSCDTITVWGQNQVGDGSGYYFTAAEWKKTYFLGAFRYKGWGSGGTTAGSAMSRGYDRVLPDGDYLIAAAGTSQKATFHYLDIEGTAQPAANDTNVSLCGPLSYDPPSYEIWTLTYNDSDGFYTIRQKNTDMCLDVYCASADEGANVQVYANNGGNAQKWAISKNGRNGYRLQAKCSGFSLDIADGAISNGTDVRQWSNNDSDAQAWLFIPYQPAQPVENGRYILVSAVDETCILDVPGNTGDIEENTRVQIWNENTQNQYNCFDVTRLENGYYRLLHTASGKALEVLGGVSDPTAAVSLHAPNGSNAQQWAIMADGYDGGYTLKVKTSGFAMDLTNAATANGSPVRQYYYNGSRAETWKFVPAEQKIRYQASEGTGAPAEQIKYYKTDLSLSDQIPERAGYEFVCWEDIFSLTEELTTDKYLPGQMITDDKALELYAVWKQIVVDYTITYDANGGEGAPAAQRVTGSGNATLSDAAPHRQRHAFLGWSTSRGADAAEYAPGATYTGNADVTLYAVWKRRAENVLVLPAALTEIGPEAFAGVAADAVVVPEGVTAIAETAFADCGELLIYGYAGSEAQRFAGRHGFAFEAITSDWVTEDSLPTGARVTDQKWTYVLAGTETVTSEETSLPGWTQAGFEWRKTGEGVWLYADYPAGFDTGSALYAQYQKAPLAASETDTAKREVSSAGHQTYIYWHWTFVDRLNSASDNTNVLVEDARKYNVLTGNVYRDYVYFDAFESATDYGTVGPGANGNIDVAPMRYAWRGNLDDVSHWWWRFDVYRQTYADYQKVFTYVKNTEELKESFTEVVPGEDVSSVQRWIKYQF